MWVLASSEGDARQSRLQNQLSRASALSSAPSEYEGEAGSAYLSLGRR
jgi:hypothetical protein